MDDVKAQVKSCRRHPISAAPPTQSAASNSRPQGPTDDERMKPAKRRMLPWLWQSPGGAASVAEPTLAAAGGAENLIARRREVQGGECRERPRKFPRKYLQGGDTERSEFVPIAADHEGCLSKQL
jgi:hypothetical protein